MLFPKRFEGRRAVVTGGAAGIGLAVATRIVAEGGTVALWDRDRAAIDAAVARIGAAASGIVASSGRRSRLAPATARSGSALSSTAAARPRLPDPTSRPGTYTPDDWRRVMAVNLDGLFYCNKALVPGMRAAEYGRIVNIASVAGKEGNPNASAYSVSKAGVIGLTKSLGKELAGSGVIVNLRRARGRPHRHLRPDDEGTPGVHARQDPDGALRRGRGDHGADHLARERGMLVLHRRRVRRIGRPGDLLRPAEAGESAGCIGASLRNALRGAARSGVGPLRAMQPEPRPRRA